MQRAFLVFALICAGMLTLATLPFSWDNWLPEYCRIHNCYCEPFREGFFVLQPASSLSNLGFVAAGLWVMATQSRSAPIPPRFYGLALIAAGLFSFFSHASLTLAGEWFDLMGVYLLLCMLIYANLCRATGLRSPLALGMAAALLTANGLQMAFAPDLQRFVILALITIAAALELLTWLRGRATGDARLLLLGIGLYAAGGLVWMLAGRGCDPDGQFPLHTIWHLLAALSAAVFYRYYVSERV